MNKKGFTLMELLAILVILAVIAVITIPIILNVVENARRGSIRNSAYGYRDGINKFYLSKFSVDSSYSIENGEYSVSMLKNMGVFVSGREPGDSSWVIITNNVVISGCLEFEGYKVEITDGVVGTAMRGSC